LGSEPPEGFLVLLDVNLDGDEILIDELSYPLIRVYLGIQPSASPSHGRGAEIQ